MIGKKAYCKPLIKWFSLQTDVLNGSIETGDYNMDWFVDELGSGV